MNQTEIALALVGPLALGGGLILVVTMLGFWPQRRHRVSEAEARNMWPRRPGYDNTRPPSPNPGLTGTTVHDNTRPTASYSSSSDGGYSGYSGYDHGHGGHDSSSDSGGCDGGGGDGGGGGGD